MKNIKNIFIIMFTLSCLFSLDLSKLENCVSFDVSLDRKEYYPGENLYLNINFKIDKGYHIYSVDPNKSLSPTYNEIIDSLYFKQTSEPIEDKPEEKFDESFDRIVSIHKNNFKVIYPLTISDQIESGNYNVSGNLEYYACDETMCIPLRENEYSFNLSIQDGDKRQEYIGSLDSKQSSVEEQINKGLFSLLIKEFLLESVSELKFNCLCWFLINN